MRDKPNEWVAVADLMSGVMAVMVLMLVAAVLLSRMVQAAEADHDKARHYVAQVMRQVGQDVAGVPGEGGMAVRVDVDARSLDLAKSLLFKSGSYDLSETQLHQLAALARSMRTRLVCLIPAQRYERKPDACPAHAEQLGTILVEGHADHQPVNHGRRFEDNLELSTKRAAVVYRALAQEIGDLKNGRGQPLLGAVGYGDTRPTESAASAGSPADSAEDRRIEIHLLFDSSDSDR